MTDVYETLTRAEPTRDRYGRPLIVPRAGGKPRPYTRPTTLADTLDDRHNLELWKMRQVTLGLVARPDLIARAATTDPTDKSTLNGIASDALDAAGSSAAANLGTAIHAAIEQVNRGHEPPEMFADAVAAYRGALERHGVEVDPDNVERFCVNELVSAAGTFDMRVRVGDRWYIADLKTGSSVEWSGRSFAIQLAIYAGATSYYDCATDTHTDPEPVDQDRALIVHLPAGGDTCTLHWLDIAAGREALDHAMWVRKWRNNKDLLTEVDAEPVAEKPKAVRKSPGKPRRTLKPVPMPPLPEGTQEAAEARTRPQRAATSVRLVDESEGELVSEERIKALRDRAIAGNTDLIKRWIAEGDAAEVGFAMGTGKNSELRFTRCLAAVTLSEGEADDDEWHRAVLALVVGDDARKPSVTIGSIIGRLTLAEAERVCTIAETATAHYDDDGRLVVEIA